MSWFQILQLIAFVVDKVLKDEDQNGKPDLFEGKSATIDDPEGSA